jgi:murein DD-endopeptidase MepM/ murein hydrolase activator NlpD
MRKKLFAAATLGLLAVLAQADPNAALTRMADGFDFPVGKPNADGYRISRGFTSHGHLGEDWVGQGGSGTDFRDPVFAIGNGVVTLARDFRRSWGNVVVLRHAFMEEGQMKYADSLYGPNSSARRSTGGSWAAGRHDWKCAWALRPSSAFRNA